MALLILRAKLFCLIPGLITISPLEVNSLSQGRERWVVENVCSRLCGIHCRQLKVGLHCNETSTSYAFENRAVGDFFAVKPALGL